MTSDPTASPDPTLGYTVEAYFRLVDDGFLGPDDGVELLDGVIVAKEPHDPIHAEGTWMVHNALFRAVGDRARVRAQLPMIASRRSAPEPDVAVVAERPEGYRRSHPREALLVVEVSNTSLPTDRLSKSRIYAGNGVPQFAIVNLRDQRVEVFTVPDPDRRVYRTRTILRRGERLDLVALPGVAVLVDDLVPRLD